MNPLFVQWLVENSTEAFDYLASKITEDENDCWNYIRVPNGRPRPYTKMFGGISYTTSPAKAMYIAMYGEVPPDDELLFKDCGNTLCINPAHMAPRQPGGVYYQVGQLIERRGEDHPDHLLTEAAVLYIRATYEEERPATRLARMFGVSVGAIMGVVTRHTWRHLE